MIINKQPFWGHQLVFYLLPGLFLLLSASGVLAQSRLSKSRIWQAPDKTRIVFELNQRIGWNLQYRAGQKQLQIQLKQTRLQKDALSALRQSHFFIKVEAATQRHDTLIRLFLRHSIKYKGFMLDPGHGYQYRLVLDLYKRPNTALKQTEVFKAMKTAPYTQKIKHNKNTITRNNTSRSARSAAKKRHIRDLIVAIDAGHGGEDPGATGKYGTHEKNIVLQIARKLARIVNTKKGMRALMIRSGDYYISLRGRTRKARKANADVFVSIHADAFRNSRAKGSSVFILSQRGATSESARWLADRENKADLAGGVSLDDKDDYLAITLLDLSQTATIEGSYSVARRILQGLRRIGRLHKKKVERAAFVVLKSPDIPSVLVETGFISNPYEEKRLKTRAYQQKLAQAIFEGIDNYFRRFPIPGTIYGQDITATIIKKKSKRLSKSAARSQTSKSTSRTKASRHLPTKKKRSISSGNSQKTYIWYRVRRGDNLSRLAKKYHTSIQRIKQLNHMRSNTLKLGSRIKIPLAH